MNKVTVERDALLERLRTNREKHAAIYAQALEGYQDKAIDKLSRLLDVFTDDDMFRRLAEVDDLRIRVDLPVPEDHTEDYDLAIQMLEMSVDDDVTLTEGEFRRFINDEWDWKRHWEASTASYTGV